MFDLNESHSVFEKEGVEGYRKYQIKNENNVLEPGTAFNFIQKLIALNSDKKNPLVEIILLSRNSADTGLRIFNSIQKHNLGIIRT